MKQNLATVFRDNAAHRRSFPEKPFRERADKYSLPRAQKFARFVECDNCPRVETISVERVEQTGDLALLRLGSSQIESICSDTNARKFFIPSERFSRESFIANDGKSQKSFIVNERFLGKSRGSDECLRGGCAPAGSRKFCSGEA